MMKKSSIFLVMLLFSCAIATLFNSCNGNDNGNVRESNSINSDIIGVWYCTYQQWAQYENKNNKSYEPSSKYMIAFEDDGAGYMNSGKDQLFEIWCNDGIKNFNWYSYSKSGKFWIHTDVYSGQDYEITELTTTSLTLTWRDDEADYIIIGKFTKMK